LIALDTNILVYARREETPYHRQAYKLLKELASSESPWALPWPCVYEFLRIVTHPRVFDPPTPLEDAVEDLESLFQSPSLVLFGEGPANSSHLSRTVRAAHASGNLVHDAHIATLAIEHGVHEFWTIDRDFTPFPDLRIRNPFVE